MAQRRSDGPSKYQLALLSTGIDVSRGISLPDELPDNVDLLTDEDVTAGRVTYVSQLMVRGLWQPKKFPPVLARKWNLPEKKVKQLVEEADRNVRIYSAIDQQETLRELNSIGHRALQMAMAQGNMLAVAQLLRVVGEHSLDPRSQKVDVTHEIRSLTDAELEKRRIELTSKLVARLPPEQKQAMLSQDNPQSQVTDAEFIEDKPAPPPPITQRMLPEDKEDQVHDQNSSSSCPDSSGGDSAGVRRDSGTGSSDLGSTG
jgi:hypothetical protein